MFPTKSLPIHLLENKNNARDKCIESNRFAECQKDTEALFKLCAYRGLTTGNV